MIVRIRYRNLKGMSGSLDLNKDTLLIGPSGSGKSGILDAIKIALTGYTERGKKPVNTIALSSGSEMEVSIESDLGDTMSRLFVEKDDGTIVQTIRINGLNIKAADVASKIPASLSFPVESIHTHEFTGLSDDKQAEFIFKALGSEVNQIGPYALPTKHDFFSKVMPYGDVLELFATNQATTSKEIERCKMTLQKLTGEAQSNTVSGTLQEWEEKKKDLGAQLSEVTGQIASNNEKLKLSASKAEHRTRLQKSIADAETKIQTSTTRIATLESGSVEADASIPSVASLQADEKGFIQKIAVLGHEVAEMKKNVLAINDSGLCPCCKTLADNLADALFDLDVSIGNKSEALEKMQKDLIAVHEKINLAKSFEKNADIKRDISIEKDAIASYEKSLKTLTDEFNKINVSSDEDPVSIEILNAKQVSLKSQIEEAEKAIKEFVAIQAIRKQKSQAEEQRMTLEETSTSLANAAKKIKAIRMERLVSIQDKLRASFDTMINSVMPNCTAFLNLIKNDKPAFEFGFYNEANARIPFATACGGEKTILLAALIACIQTLTTARPGLGLFELAEADQSIIEAFLKALPDVGFQQTIAATCHSPSDASIQELLAANPALLVISMKKPVVATENTAA